jgi:hypothetical protein
MQSGQFAAVEGSVARYDLDLASQQALLRELVSGGEHLLWLPQTSFPAMGSMSVYLVPGDLRVADVARTLEGSVFEQTIGFPRAAMAADYHPIEANSFFWMAVSQLGSDRLELAMLLRFADLGLGPSESALFFEEAVGPTAPVAAELHRRPGERVLDVVNVVIPPYRRDGITSAWLYHALYRHGLEHQFSRWTCNVTAKEGRNLRNYLGAPFTEIPPCEPAIYTSLTTSQTTEFRVYSANVAEVHSTVSTLITDRDHRANRDNNHLEHLLASVARIGLLGDPDPATAT